MITIRKLLLSSVAVLTLTMGSQPQAEPMNVIYFLSDDHRADFLGCAGHPIVRTPVLDGLASRGIRFEQSFVTTSICAASRASILTGLYERTHKFTFGTPPISKEHIAASYPAILKSAGFRTGFVGKFGVSVPPRAQTEVMFDYFQPLNRSPYIKTLADGTKRHVTDIAGDRAIDFLKSTPSDQPFCLSVSFNAAHAEDGDKVNHFPWPESEDGLYEDITIPEPINSDPAIFENHPQFLKESMNRVRYYWRWDTPEKYQRNVKAYYRMITGLDRVIGRVLSALKDSGRDENTVIIFSGDNGYYKGARGFAGKWSHYEESLRVPLIIFDPRVAGTGAAGLVDKEHMALNIDIPATILEAAGQMTPTHYQGRSLLSLAHGKEPENWRDAFFCEHLMDNAQIPKWDGLRHKRFVYANYFQQDGEVGEFLHDLWNDPNQLVNLRNDAAYKNVLKEFRTRMKRLRDSIGGEYSIENFPTRRWLESRKSPSGE